MDKLIFGSKASPVAQSSVFLWSHMHPIKSSQRLSIQDMLEWDVLDPNCKLIEYNIIIIEEIDLKWNTIIK